METFDFVDGNGPVPAHRHQNPDGNKGGWVAETANVAKTAKVDYYALIFGKAKVSGSSWVSGTARISGSAWLSCNAEVSGLARVFGNAKVSGYARVLGNAQVFGNAHVSGTTLVSGFEKIFNDAESDTLPICSAPSILGW